MIFLFTLGGEDKLMDLFPMDVITVEVWVVEHKKADNWGKPILDPQFVKWYCI